MDKEERRDHLWIRRRGEKRSLMDKEERRGEITYG